MNKILSLYVVGLVLFAGIVLIAGCATEPSIPSTNPINPSGTNTGSQLSNPNMSTNMQVFNTTAQLDEFLQQRQSSQYPSYGRGLMMDGIASTTASKESGGAADYSQTNVQVSGVDEADFVKNDDKYIYLVQNGVLMIVDAFDQKEIISETDLPKNHYASNIFLYENKVVVLAQSSEESFYFQKYDIRPSPTYESITKVLIYDVSDRENPELSEDFKVSGDYFQSRMIGDVVYLISVKYASYPARPPVIFAEKMISPSIYYFDNGDDEFNYNTIISVNVDSEEIIDSQTYLLGYSNTLMMSEDNIFIAYQKQPYRCWGWYCRDNTYEKERFTKIVVPLLQGELKSDIKDILDMDISEDEQWKMISERLSELYEDIRDNEDAQDLYEDMFSDIEEALSEYDEKQLLENSKTIIHKISVDEGKLDYIAQGEVDGRLLNQYSLDEYEGNLRVATTVDLWMNSGRRTYNNVYVLDDELDIIGSVEDIAKNETIYSTRFMGEKLYMVTFRQIDPFFVVDLSDPKDPQIIGKLKIPGYSSYLHPYNENFIIGVGKETGENEWGGVSTKGVKLSLFDVSDANDPIEVDKYEIGMQGTDSPILYEPKAFLLFDNILVIPISEVTSRDASGYGYDYSYWDGAYVFEVSQDGFELLGKVKHDARKTSYYSWWDRASVTRSIIMDNELFTISNKFIKVNDLDDDLSSIASIELPNEQIYYGPYYGGGAVAETIVR